jgi:hypothetical protein
MSSSSPVEWPSVSLTSLKPSRSNSAIAVGRLQASQLLLQLQPVRQPGELIVVREPPQLLFRLHAIGDVFIDPGHAADAAVGIMHRCRGDPDIDKRAIFAPAFGLYVADGLAPERPIEQCLR